MQPLPIQAIATCPQSLRDLVQYELRQIGITDAKQGFRCVHFNTDKQNFYAAHLKLRSASRIFRVIKVVPAQQLKFMYEKARRVNWSNYFNVDQSYIINGIAADREHNEFTGNEISKNIRLAIEDSFQHHQRKIPKVDLDEPDVTIFAHVSEGRCTIGFDTSGKALHKRGYRLSGHPAPLKETLAAAIVMMMGYKGQTVFYDPMCGSGTLPIEAAYIALKKAPLIHRKKLEFDFEKLADFDKDLWRVTQENTRNERIAAPAYPIFASDIRGEYVNMARENALRARVEKDIDFSYQDFLTSVPPASGGMICMNLPYGERLEVDDLRIFYQEIGDKLALDFKGWRAGLFTNEDAPYKDIGLDPKKSFPLLNGSIKTRLLVIDL